MKQSHLALPSGKFKHICCFATFMDSGGLAGTRVGDMSSKSNETSLNSLWGKMLCK